MDKLSETLVLEARTILYVLQCITEGNANWDEDIPRQEMVYLLDEAKARLDSLSSAKLI